MLLSGGCKVILEFEDELCPISIMYAPGSFVPKEGEKKIKAIQYNEMYY